MAAVVPERNAVSYETQLAIETLRSITDDRRVWATVTPKHGVEFVLPAAGVQEQNGGLGTINFGNILISSTELEENDLRESTNGVCENDSSVDFINEENNIPSMYNFSESKKSVLASAAGQSSTAIPENMPRNGFQDNHLQTPVPLGTEKIQSIQILNRNRSPVLLKAIAIYPPDLQKELEEEERSEIVHSKSHSGACGSDALREQIFQIKHPLNHSWHSGTQEPGIYSIGAWLPPDQNLLFPIEIKCAPVDQDTGFIGKWMLAFFEFTEPGGDVLDFTKRQFTVGCRLLAAAASGSAARALLSSDAPPFVPRALRQTFETGSAAPVAQIHPAEFPFRPAALQQPGCALPEYPVDATLWQAFRRARQEGRLLTPSDHPVLHQFAAGPPGAAAGPPGAPPFTPGGGGGGGGGGGRRSLGEHLRRLGVLLLLEECQMAWDIRKYDMFHQQWQSIRVQTNDLGRPIHYGTLHVPGASENRPNLIYGETVRLRALSRPSLEIHAVVVRRKENYVTVQLPSQLPNANAHLQNQYDAIIQEWNAYHDSGKRNKRRIIGKTSYAAAASPQRDEKKTEEKQAPKFHVGFCYSRQNLQYCHHVLQSILRSEPPLQRVQGSGHVIFDMLGNTQLVKAMNPEVARQWEQVPLGADPRANVLQLQCVRDVLLGGHTPLPYLIFGPPGTGKTLTVVEAVRQILINLPHARVLACAPSDAAADIICERLSEHFGTDQMLRLNSWQRDVATLPPSLLRYCRQDETTAVFVPPPLPELLEFKVTVSTAAGAGLLHTLGVPAGHYSHILVDESSQAMEPEVLIPLALAGPRTSAVLAGDPRQLGPGLRCPEGRRWGLAVGLQERLMAAPPYVTGEATPGRRCLTQLTANYRSHEGILAVPNAMFYQNRLEQCAKAAVTDNMLRWELLASGGGSGGGGGGWAAGGGPAGLRSPVVFYGVNGQFTHGRKHCFPGTVWCEDLSGPGTKDMHELDSPSFFNPTEAEKIVEVVELLLSSTKVQVTTADIGIISAFRMQVLKLRHLLRAKNLSAINVGQVEHFQGQEERIILISTTLSQRHAAATDGTDGRLGFLGDPKKFNVAVTRAKALLIVFGSPFLLMKEPYWKEMFQYAVSNGTYRGCACPGVAGTEDAGSDDLFLQTVARLSLLGSGAFDQQFPGDGRPAAAGFFDNDEPEWRVAL